MKLMLVTASDLGCAGHPRADTVRHGFGNGVGQMRHLGKTQGWRYVGIATFVAWSGCSATTDTPQTGSAAHDEGAAGARRGSEVAPQVQAARDDTGDDVSGAWFNEDACAKLTISRHGSISDHTVVTSLTLEDPSAIAALMRRISALPTKGGMMMKPGPDTPLTTLEFQCGAAGTSRSLRIMGGRLITPSTGLLSPEPPEETAIVADVEALLAPARGKRLLKVEGLELRFAGFGLTYLGRTTRDPGQKSASSTTERYQVRVGDQVEELAISSGQLPPGPTSFRVGLSKRTLYTYETPAGARLYPDFWVVE